MHKIKPTLSGIDLKRCAALEPTLKDKRLVGCLVGSNATKKSIVDKSKKATRYQWSHESGRPFFPCPMPSNQDCWVLDWYIITDYWKALTDAGQTTMVRLERWKLEDKAWFASKESSHDPPPLSARDFSTKAPVEKCKFCLEFSTRMFDDYFVCRNETCAQHWRHNGEIVQTDLTYTKAFLQQREPRPADGFKPYVPYKDEHSFPDFAAKALDVWQEKYKDLESKPITEANFESRMAAMGRGFWCPECGMLNRRLKWNEWICANTECTFTMDGRPPLLAAPELTAIKKSRVPDWTKKEYFTREEDTGDHMRYHFHLIDDCDVTVIVPKEGTNSKHQGSDWLLDRFQRSARNEEMLLQKQFVQGKVPGTVTNHYIHNYGHSYNLDINIQQNTPFEDAPSELRIARDAANSLCQEYQSPHGQEPFNQCYVAGYFTNNAMNYHTDGEKGIGNVIATWTLGGEGKFSVIPLPNQYFGRTKNNKPMTEKDLLLPGILFREERVKFKQDLEAKLAVTQNKAERRAARAECRQKFVDLMEKQTGLKKQRGSKVPKAVLEIPLTHGMVVVMHGKKMQKWFKHSVNVKTPLRFALTYRTVTSENDDEKGLSGKKKGQYPHTPDRSYLDRPLDDVEEAVEEKEAEAEGEDASESESEKISEDEVESEDDVRDEDEDMDESQAPLKPSHKPATKSKPMTKPTTDSRSKVSGKRRKDDSDDDMSENDDKSNKRGKGASKKKGDTKDVLLAKRKRDDDDDDEEGGVGSKDVRPGKVLKLTLRNKGGK